MTDEKYTRRNATVDISTKRALLRAATREQALLISVTMVGSSFWYGVLAYFEGAKTTAIIAAFVCVSMLVAFLLLSFNGKVVANTTE